MELNKKITSNIPFSLHDSRIMRMEITNDFLTLFLDEVYEYKNNSEKYYPANITFNDIDYEECNILVFNKGVVNGRFSGVRYEIKEYINKFADTEFEILTESYGTYSTVLEGLVWRDGNDPVSGIINIWNTGDVVFKFE